jgi:hypothetical protein
VEGTISMTKTKRKDTIAAKAVELLRSEPQGIHYSKLVARVHDALPEVPINTVHGNIWNLEVTHPEEVVKPARGLYIHSVFYKINTDESIVQIAAAKPKVKEERFYRPFAEWLMNDLEECTKAIPVGGNLFRDKWGTPDVIGVREPRKSDIIKFPTEIVSAEVKLDPAGLITAFGQACAYRLFSHKAYLVIPAVSSEDDISRLDTLSRIFGIGLILFNPQDPDNPEFEIRVRATKHEPDMFYVNRCMKTIEDDLFD